jgi:DNA-binding NtrC family response regulator
MRTWIALQRYCWPGNIRELGNVVGQNYEILTGSANVAWDYFEPPRSFPQLPRAGILTGRANAAFFFGLERSVGIERSRLRYFVCFSFERT